MQNPYGTTGIPGYAKATRRSDGDGGYGDAHPLPSVLIAQNCAKTVLGAKRHQDHGIYGVAVPPQPDPPKLLNLDHRHGRFHARLAAPMPATEAVDIRFSAVRSFISYALYRLDIPPTDQPLNQNPTPWLRGLRLMRVDRTLMLKSSLADRLWSSGAVRQSPG
ncbi:MAG: hypothetical protein Fur0042_23140 [Cyanophyceae cyanobacterium]